MDFPANYPRLRPTSSSRSGLPATQNKFALATIAADIKEKLTESLMELGCLRICVVVLGENLHSFCSWSRKYSKDGAPRRRGVFLAYRMSRIEEGFVRPQIQHGMNCVLLVSRKLCSCSSRRGEEGVKKFGCMVAGSCMVGAEDPRGPAA